MSHHGRLPTRQEHAGDVDYMVLTVAALIARGEADHIDVTEADFDRLRELYPKGWGVVLAGYASGTFRVSLVGEQSKEVVADLLGKLIDGDEIGDHLHPSFMPDRPRPDG